MTKVSITYERNKYNPLRLDMFVNDFEVGYIEKWYAQKGWHQKSGTFWRGSATLNAQDNGHGDYYEAEFCKTQKAIRAIIERAVNRRANEIKDMADILFMENTK